MTVPALLQPFPHIPLGHFPTPLHPLNNLRKALGGGPRLFVKRDDCTGLATGGNKTRKLEYLIGDARQQSTKTIVTQGAVQSNHVRQTAAAAAYCGMTCAALLERRVPDRDADYEKNGNVLLDRMLNLHYEFRPDGTDMNAEALAWSRGFADAYFIPGGGSNEIGALGYVRCAYELSEQARQSDIKIDWLVHGTGSAGTQSGLLAGFAALDSPIKVSGISVRPAAAQQQITVSALAQKTLDKLGVDKKITPEEVRVDDNFVGPGYGQMTDETIAAIRLLAQTEGIFLDPVYSGKGFAGLLSHIRAGVFADSETVVFLHTGGVASLFAYQRDFFGD